jgi:hypothetical protein
MTAHILTDLAITNTSNEMVTDEPLTAVVGSGSQDEIRQAVDDIIEIALISEDMGAVATALRALNPFLSLDSDKEATLDKRMLDLIDQGLVYGNPALAEAIAQSVYERSRERVSVALPFIPALLSFMEMDMSTIGAPSYYTLIIIAADAPDHLGPFVGTLIGKLAGPCLVASTFAARIITVLARNRPEYVADARDALRNLCERCPEGVLKTEATKAYQAIEGHITPEGDSGGCRRDEQAIASSQETPADLDGTTISGSRPAVARSSLSIDYERLLSIIARLLHIRGGINEPTIESEKLDQMANEMCELVRWIESEFPLTEEALNAKAASVSREEIKALSKREAPADVLLQETAPEPATVPALPAVETQPQKIEVQAEARDCHTDSSIDTVEVAAMRGMIAAVESDFSVTAGSILDAIGMGHLKPGMRGEDPKINAKEFITAFEKIIKEQKYEASTKISGKDTSGTPVSESEAKFLVSELKRCVNPSMPAPASVSAPDMTVSPVPPAEKKSVLKIMSQPASSRSPKARRHYQLSGTKKCIKIDIKDDRKMAR